MSKIQGKEKGAEKKRSTNYSKPPQKLQEIFGDIQKKGIQMQLSLSPTQIQHLNAQHPLLISSSTMSELVKTFDKDMFRQIKQQSNPEMIKLYTSWKQWMQNSIQKNNTERRDLVSKLIDPQENQLRKNPMDDYQKRKSLILSRQIRQRQEFFKIKTNFAAYAKKHFEKQNQQLKDFIDYKAHRVDQKTIQQMFKNPEQRRFHEINNYFEEKQREENVSLVNLLRQTKKINKFNLQKEKMVRKEKLKNQKLTKQNACKQLGNSAPLLVNLHDAFTFAKT